MRVLAIDPGRNHVGYAAGEHQLQLCGVSKLPAAAKVWSLDRVCNYHTDALNSIGLTNYRYDRVVVERMGIRMQDAQGKTPQAKLARVVAIANDLLLIQSVGAHIAGRVGGSLQYVQHWLCSKEITQNRVEFLLRPDEKELYSAVKCKKKDDVADAVCHWLRAVGRM